MLVEPSGELSLSILFLIFFLKRVRVAAIADKLGVDFALIHRKRDGKSEGAPEKMELLVGDVKDKVRPDRTALL